MLYPTHEDEGEETVFHVKAPEGDTEIEETAELYER
jgi:hypothetical protein